MAWLAVMASPSAVGCALRLSQEAQHRRGELGRVLNQERVPCVLVNEQLRTGDLSMQQARIRDGNVHVAGPGSDQRLGPNFAQLAIRAAVRSVPAVFCCDLASSGLPAERLAAAARLC